MIENNDMPLVFTMNLEGYLTHILQKERRTVTREIQREQGRTEQHQTEQCQIGQHQTEQCQIGQHQIEQHQTEQRKTEENQLKKTAEGTQLVYKNDKAGALPNGRNTQNIEEILRL